MNDMKGTPDGYSTVSPYLIVDGASIAMDFVKAVFDATEIRRFEDDEGGIVHAEVRIGDSVVMIADANEAWPATRSHLYVYVPDVDEAYGRALAAGGRSLQAPERKEDEDRRAGVRDPSGTSWWIATRAG